MGNLRVTKEGVRLEGVSEFLLPLYVKEVQSRWVRRVKNTIKRKKITNIFVFSDSSV